MIVHWSDCNKWSDKQYLPHFIAHEEMKNPSGAIKTCMKCLMQKNGKTIKTATKFKEIGGKETCCGHF